MYGGGQAVSLNLCVYMCVCVCVCVCALVEFGIASRNRLKDAEMCERAGGDACLLRQDT